MAITVHSVPVINQTSPHNFCTTKRHPIPYIAHYFGPGCHLGRKWLHSHTCREGKREASGTLLHTDKRRGIFPVVTPGGIKKQMSVRDKAIGGDDVCLVPECC